MSENQPEETGQDNGDEKKYVVSAPMVYLKVPDVTGKHQMMAYYRGAPVPGNVEAANLQHHIDSDLIIEVKDEIAEVVAVPAGTPIPGQPPNVEVTETTPIGFQEPAEVLNVAREASGVDTKPGKSASKDEWVSYAETQGMSEDEAKQHSKQELIDLYG